MINENWYQTAIEDYGIKEILYEELSEEKEKIGSGGFGKIYKTKCNSLGTVAIKEITIDIEVDIKRFIKELKLHSQIKHERIILFHGISRDEHKGHYLVLEYAKQGNLREFITKRFKEGEFKWAERKRLAIQIAEGLRYLHNEKNIIHRDLHTKNILIDDGNVKISDFGLSKNLDSTTISTDNRAFGVIPFVDPQKLNNKNFVLDKKSDIYSLGMVLWEISSLRERPITGTPIEYKQIYVDCWELDPDSRPLVVEVLSRLESMSLEPVFEGDDEYPTYYPPSSPENTSGFNPSMASYIIPDGPTNPTTSSTNTVCNKCGKQLMNHDRCCECVLHALQEDFSNWTSEDEDLDKLIKVSQINAAVKNHDEYFEWIDYSQFKNKKWIIQGSYCDIYTATWTDGIRKRWDKQSQQWERTKDSQIILRKFRFKSTIKNLNLHLEIKSAIRYPDSKKRPTTQDLLDELENFTTTSLKKQFDNVDQELRDQPLGTRPKQLKDNNVITKSSINVKESYAGEIRFRFTNKQLKQLQFYNVPEP
ncbi:uncharacterized protein OCT59_020679 [Rhizophagus irregularis]|uniref:uncharacterized protein n=1 Tax=Rhizophagus irregularis TaxID=588596 RepID=UPI0033206EA4|nr:hypothetical protein OCT59_020679 [Rhizophagus irregularis]